MREKALKRKLDVYFRDDLVGRLWLDERRRFVFQYDTARLKRKSPIPLSLSLPLTAEPYLDDTARPFFSNLLPEAGIRLSLAGAQSKLPVYLEGNRVFLATGNAPSTHILKPPIAGLEESVENEAFCMTLAARIGLAVPKAIIRQGHDRLYIVERYDRERNPEGEIVRLHQEDFCQALGILPEQKYEAEGGPSLERCFALLKEKSVSPASDQKALLLWVVFNALIGNADAHAKNLAIIYRPLGPRLAPFYDLISTLVYPDLSARLAMRIGGENRLNWIQRRHWARFSHEVGIKPRWIEKMVREISQSISPIAASVAQDFTETQWKIQKVVGHTQSR